VSILCRSYRKFQRNVSRDLAGREAMDGGVSNIGEV